MMAVGGFRTGTLLALQYKNVKYDLERNIIPVHVHIDALITKGKYCSYDTFLNEESTEYLRAYLDTRRKGTATIPPEKITDTSPIIRNYLRNDEIYTITPSGIHRAVHDLYFKAGIASLLPACEASKSKIQNRYDVRVHSLRKFFRTELASRGVNPEYIEYMMGHRTDSYHDVKMKGVEFLRGIYLTAGITIRPKIKLGKIETLKEIIQAWGLNPEEILNQKVLDQSNSHDE
jgi:integrase